jgi:thiamine-phosphate pyrophosphorylase
MDDSSSRNESNDRYAAHRILDANLNRACEALRTLEDVARFTNQAYYQRQYKTLRHQLVGCTAGWDYLLLLTSRNAQSDVGREAKTSSELLREFGLSDICKAAAQRIQQSLRSLEEVAKYLYPNSARDIESVRYQMYDVNAQFLILRERDLAFLDRAILYVLVDCKMPIRDFQLRIQEISLGGAGLIQIRDKQCDAQELVRYAQAAMEAVDRNHTRIIINDRADVANCSDVWGVHVGQTDLSVDQCRSILRGTQIVGQSTHDLSQVMAAIHSKADYIGCGPTFPSHTKEFETFSGLAFLETVARQLRENDLRLPAYAIGGIDTSNLHQVIDAGIGRVAVSKAVWESSSPGHAAESLHSQLEKV